MSRHYTIDAEFERMFTFPGLAPGEVETTVVKAEITYDYVPGSPAFTPRGEYAPVDPPEPAEVSLVSAVLIDGGGLNPDAKQLADWADDWLTGEGYGPACDHAQACMQPDPDAAYEAMRDDPPDPSFYEARDD